MQLGKAKSITLVTWSVGHRERDRQTELGKENMVHVIMDNAPICCTYNWMYN